MTLAGHVENGQIVLEESAALPEGTKLRIEVLAEQDLGDPGCFDDAGPATPLDQKTKTALRALLTEEQFKALVEVTDHGGPDVDAIRRLRAASMV